MVELLPLTADNFKQVIHLTVAESQTKNVAQGVPVGFLLYGPDPETGGTPWLLRFMIDAKMQGKGYGTAALYLLLKEVRAAYPVQPCIKVSAYPQAKAALALYQKAGFAFTGEMEDDELVLQLNW